MKKLVIPPVFFLVTIICMVVFYFVLPGFNLIPYPFNLTGLFIAFGGFVIMGKARDLFRKHQTTLQIAASSSLITDGIFSKTRNPMYLGMFILLFGIGLCLMNIFSIIGAIAFLVSIRYVFIPKEEKMLLETFGDEYLDYRGKVGRWL